MQKTVPGARVDLDKTDPVLESFLEVSKGREASQEVRGGRGCQGEGGHENSGVLFV